MDCAVPGVTDYPPKRRVAGRATIGVDGAMEQACLCIGALAAC